MEKHHVEAWGLWWSQWQTQLRERLQKHAMSPQVFVNEHLVSSKGERLSGNTATSLILPPK